MFFLPSVSIEKSGPNFSQKFFFGCASLILLIAVQLRAASRVTNELNSVSAEDARVSVATPAKWIVPLKFERLPKQANIDPGEEQHWLLSDHQINAQENETFSHDVRQILTSGGVGDGSQIKVEFDPSFQSVVFHWVRLWRGTNALNRLALDKIKVIQQERDLDRNLFYGDKTAVLLLEDVRAGDILDYAYSLRADKPAFAGNFSRAVEAQLEFPIERLTTRLLWPAQKKLFIKNHGTGARPVMLRKGNFFEYTWDFKKVAGVRSEGSLPAWFDPLPWIQLSAFEKWTEVNQWALSLFKDSSALSPDLKQKINEWKRIRNREECVAAVLQFLQEEVRYLGIETGVNALKPTDPSAVFSQRFGDCKDKTMLLVTILRALGMEANPVLVHSKWRHTIADWLPSMAAFDHAITQARVDGKTFWLDATATYERGPLATRYWPDYGQGLVITPKTMGLTIIPRAGSAAKTTVTEYFDVRMRNEPADLKIVTEAEGSEAEMLREQFARTGRQDLEKNYLNLRAADYPSIRSSRGIDFSDDEKRNRVVLTEHYTIQRMWTQSSSDSPWRCRFWPHNIGGALAKPAVAFRSMPLAVRFPEHQVFRAEINLPGAWPVLNEDRMIDDPAFSCRIVRTAAGKKVSFDYEYESLSDWVPANHIGGYLQHIDEAVENLGYELTWP